MAEAADPTADDAELTAAEAADRYGIAARTVREWARTGLLAGRPARGGQRFARAEVERLVRERGLDGSTAEDRARAADETARLIDRLARENTEMAGRIGYLMAQNEALSGRVKQIEAPKPAPVIVLPREVVPADEPEPTAADGSGTAEDTAPAADDAVGLWARLRRLWRGEVV